MPQELAEDGREKGKKKKWWGELFKRRSRKVSSESSSDEGEEAQVKRRGFLRRRKTDRGSKDVTNSFLINSSPVKLQRSEAVPTRGRSLESVKTTSADKRRLKKKVEESREKLAGDSSSEESSYSSSLPSVGSFPRRSRAARTERHNRRLWSASVVYQESNDYDTKYKIKARSATPSPAASPKVRQRAVSQDSMAPPPPPRRLDPIPKYTAPMYTGVPKLKRFNGHSDPVLPKDWDEKPPTAPPRRSIEEKKRQAHLEEALNELEAIYKKLEDLQEPVKNDEEIEPKAEDDMAYRRLNRRTLSTQDVRDIMSQSGSYLLVSPTLSPQPIVQVPSPLPGIEPDVTFDDVVYRSMTHTNNTLKCLDPQPPFGIPLGPISPAPSSDYLHARPGLEYRPPNTPDLVMDDLAFRNLRKDGQELRKKKAVRSLSANLTNVIFRNNNDLSAVNNNIDKARSYSDIPEEMRLAQRVLDMRRSKARRKDEELLKELEDEARATSYEIEQKLSKSGDYSRSMADLLEELTKNLDYDFGDGCNTCDAAPLKPNYPREYRNMEPPTRRKPWQSHLRMTAKSVEEPSMDRIVARPKWSSVHGKMDNGGKTRGNDRFWPGRQDDKQPRPWLRRQEEVNTHLPRFEYNERAVGGWSSVKLPERPQERSPSLKRKEERHWSSVKLPESKDRDWSRRPKPEIEDRNQRNGPQVSPSLLRKHEGPKTSPKPSAQDKYIFLNSNLDALPPTNTSPSLLRKPYEGHNRRRSDEDHFPSPSFLRKQFDEPRTSPVDVSSPSLTPRMSPSFRKHELKQSPRSERKRRTDEYSMRQTPISIEETDYRPRSRHVWPEPDPPWPPSSPRSNFIARRSPIDLASIEAEAYEEKPLQGHKSTGPVNYKENAKL